jgi:hypothetical protein
MRVKIRCSNAATSTSCIARASGTTSGLKDVERFYILLKPWRRQLYRLIILGRKRLPDPEQHDRFWAFVWRVFRDREELNEELGEKGYATKTRGIRKVAPARPAAEGIQRSYVDDDYYVGRSYNYYGGPGYYRGPAYGGYYGGGPSVGFSFGTGRW